MNGSSYYNIKQFLRIDSLSLSLSLSLYGSSNNYSNPCKTVLVRFEPDSSDGISQPLVASFIPPYILIRRTIRRYAI